MGKLTSSILLAVAMSTLLQAGEGAAVVPSAAGYKYVGSIQQTQSNRASGYFLSQNAAAWSTAEKDCKRIFGDDSSLAYIETPEELIALYEFFEGDDTATLFWTGGRYDTRLNAFIWHNRVLFEEWAPWEAGFPNTRFSTTRVAAIREPGMEVQFQTHLLTKSLRYICEYPM